MEITYLGHASFKLRGREASVVTDPYDSEFVGIKFPNIESDIVTISHQHQDHNQASQIQGNPLLIQGAGEYEVKGVRIVGISSYHDLEQGKERGENIIYHIIIDGISVVHCGDLGHKLTESQVEILDGIDILLLPVGGFYTLPVKMSLEVINQLEPLITIPMHYQTPAHIKSKFGMLSPLNDFLKELGKENIIPLSKFNITKDKKPTESSLIILESP